MINEDVINKILRLAYKMGLILDVKFDNHWEGHHEHTIGIPTKKQINRKIWRGFFFVRPEEDNLCFYAPDKPDIRQLSEKYGIELKEEKFGTVSGSLPLPNKTVFLSTSLTKLDFDNPKHINFIKFIIETRRSYCGR